MPRDLQLPTNVPKAARTAPSSVNKNKVRHKSLRSTVDRTETSAQVGSNVRHERRRKGGEATFVPSARWSG